MALKNIRVIELAGLAPSSFCGLILSDFGAEVIRIDRIGGDPLRTILSRGKKSLQIDLKRPEGVHVMEKLVTKADVLIEPFRAGVMEKMGLGPEKLLELNKRLVYARLSGFGQQGTLSKAAGHDINYLAISGVLSLLGPPNPDCPSPPINLLADFASGGLLCALGITLALHERSTSGLGQVIDANMTQGSSYLSSWIYESRINPLINKLVWPNKSERGRNLLDGGAPFYSVYKTSDNKFMAVGSLEPQFFSVFCSKIGLDDSYFPGIIDDSMRDKLKTLFAEKTQAEWIEIFSDVDACVTPVVDYEDAANHEHNKQSNSFCADGSPAPAPKLSRTPAEPELAEQKIDNLVDLLKNFGITEADAGILIEKKIVAVSNLQSKL